jgi:AcrR family transcriptional regulator
MDSTTTGLTVLDQITASDKVRKKIIDAASALYAKKGFAETSIQEISEAAGVSLPVTYHYVKKKSEIMRMIMEDVLNLFQEGLVREIKGIDDPKQKLDTAIVLYFTVVEQQREKALLIYQKSSSLDKTSRSHVMQLEVEVCDVFRKILDEGIQQGVFKHVDVDLMAYNIIMMAHMFVLKRWHFKHRLTLEKYIDLQRETIMNVVMK